MHIIADVNKILKAVQGNLTFILNVLSESFTQNGFYEKWGCITVRN